MMQFRHTLQRSSSHAVLGVWDPADRFLKHVSSRPGSQDTADCSADRPDAAALYGRKRAGL